MFQDNYSIFVARYFPKILNNLSDEFLRTGIINNFLDEMRGKLVSTEHHHIFVDDFNNIIVVLIVKEI